MEKDMILKKFKYLKKKDWISLLRINKKWKEENIHVDEKKYRTIKT